MCLTLLSLDSELVISLMRATNTMLVRYPIVLQPLLLVSLLLLMMMTMMLMMVLLLLLLMMLLLAEMALCGLDLSYALPSPREEVTFLATAFH